MANSDNSNNQYSAAKYALRDITGTDAIAFETLVNRISVLQITRSALDLGCGGGRSTRFLKALNLQTVGIDVSEEMISEARLRDPKGRYLFCNADQPVPFDDGAFDLVLSTWVVLEISARKKLCRFIEEFARVLHPGGVGFIVSNTADFYCHRWVSCEVDFPENQPPLCSGQRVKARLMPENVIVTDTFWTDNDYRAAFNQSGLRVAYTWYPVASPSQTFWHDETRVAPWVIYEVKRMQQ